MTLNNSRQKINDCLGTPVEIGIAVIWRVVDTAKKQIPLRVSHKLYDALAKWAEDDFRSINGQIEYLLTECVKKARNQA